MDDYVEFESEKSGRIYRVWSDGRVYFKFSKHHIAWTLHIDRISSENWSPYFMSLYKKALSSKKPIHPVDLY